MIRYDYRCEECCKVFEVQKESYTDKKKEKCPNCKSLKVRKIIGSIPVIYKDNDFTLSKTKSE